MRRERKVWSLLHDRVVGRGSDKTMRSWGGMVKSTLDKLRGLEGPKTVVMKCRTVPEL